MPWPGIGGVPRRASRAAFHGVADGAAEGAIGPRRQRPGEGFAEPPRRPGIERRHGREHPGRRPRLDIAFDFQRLVGAHHGVAADAELFGQAAGGRQPDAGGDAAHTNGVTQLGDELSRQRVGARAVEQQADLDLHARAPFRPGAAFYGSSGSSCE